MLDLFEFGFEIGSNATGEVALGHILEHIAGQRHRTVDACFGRVVGRLGVFGQLAEIGRNTDIDVEQHGFEHGGQCLGHGVHLAHHLLGGGGNLATEPSGFRGQRFSHHIVDQPLDQRFKDHAIAANVPARFQPDFGVTQANARAGREIGIVELAGRNRLPVPDLLGLGAIHLRLAIKELGHGRHRGNLGVEFVERERQMHIHMVLHAGQRGACALIEPDEVEAALQYVVGSVGLRHGRSQ